jgi:hypothetical protein
MWSRDRSGLAARTIDQQPSGKMSVKNQYFGDSNDYRKYGLLRALCEKGGVRLAVCWMLTPDDGGTDGKFIQYLQQPERWCHHDPALYHWLKGCVLGDGGRNVCRMEHAGLLRGSRFYAAILPDDATGRETYFERFWQTARGCDLVFFDPDNGLEVKSRPYGRQYSSKYLYWSELEAGHSQGYSLIVYQHFPRIRRDAFVAGRAVELRQRLGSSAVYTFRTPHVVYFLLLQQAHAKTLAPGIETVRERWRGQIAVARW